MAETSRPRVENLAPIRFDGVLEHLEENREQARSDAASALASAVIGLFAGVLMVRVQEQYRSALAYRIRTGGGVT